jgi:hypothetical protein
MDIKLDADDLEFVEHLQKNSKPVRYLKAREELNFNVGDIIVHYRKDWDWDDENKFKLIPQKIKFVCVHVDEYKVAYVRRINLTKDEPGKEIFCMADFDHINNAYQLDPNYAEHLILSPDEKFNPNQSHKDKIKETKRVDKLNKNLAINLGEDINKTYELFANLVPGSKFWCGAWIREVVDIPYTVKDVKIYARSKVPKKYKDNCYDVDWDTNNGKSKVCIVTASYKGYDNMICNEVFVCEEAYVQELLILITPPYPYPGENL